MTVAALHAETAGSGPDVVLLHGLFGMGSNLGALARALAERFRVHSLDLPDHGRSAWTEGGGLPAMAAAVVAWLDEQGIDRAACCGHSLGGKVAMQLALEMPARVSALVVADIAPVAYGPSHGAVFAGLAAVEKAGVASRRDAAAILREHIEEEGVVQFLLLSLARDDGGRWRWRFNRAGLEANYPAYLAAPSAPGPYQGPTLFIRGERSPYVEDAHAPVIRSLFPDAELKVMAGCGHWLHAEKPALFNSLVQRFLEAGAASAAATG